MSPGKHVIDPQRLLMRLLKRLLILSATLLGMAATVPLLWPIPALQDTRSAAVVAETIADPFARFVDIEGLSIYVEDRGVAGDSRLPLVLLHGFPASTFTWRELIEPLSHRGRVVAFDRPGFGLSARPLPPEDQENFAEGHDPYSAQSQVRQTLALMDELDIERAILLGSQSGGTLALRVALARPERIAALILIAPAIASGDLPPWLRRLFDTPQLRRIGPLLSRDLRERSEPTIDNASHDRQGLDKQIRLGTRRTFAVDDWDQALWRYTLAYHSPDELLPRLANLDISTLVITGAGESKIDRSAPSVPSAPSTSEELAAALKAAEFVEIAECGPLPQEECPAPTLAAIDAFLQGLRE